MVVDGAGNLFIPDTYSNRVRKASSNVIISTTAGTGTVGFSGDSLQIADAWRIRKVSMSGIITMLAGRSASGDVQAIFQALRPSLLSASANG